MPACSAGPPESRPTTSAPSDTPNRCAVVASSVSFAIYFVIAGAVFWSKRKPIAVDAGDGDGGEPAALTGDSASAGQSKPEPTTHVNA